MAVALGPGCVKTCKGFAPGTLFVVDKVKTTVERNSNVMPIFTILSIEVIFYLNYFYIQYNRSLQQSIFLFVFLHQKTNLNEKKRQQL